MSYILSHSIESHLHQISQPSSVQDKHPFVTLTLHPCHQKGPDPLKSHYTSVHPHYHHTRCIQRLKFRPAISPTRLSEYNNNKRLRHPFSHCLSIRVPQTARIYTSLSTLQFQCVFATHVVSDVWKFIKPVPHKPPQTVLAPL